MLTEAEIDACDEGRVALPALRGQYGIDGFQRANPLGQKTQLHYFSRGYSRPMMCSLP
jgi:hypothetical protein